MPVDLYAPITPAQSAAGFLIGTSLEDLHDALHEATECEYKPGVNLVEKIRNNTGILKVTKLGPDEGPTFYFGPDIVRLIFNHENRLACVYVFDGYLGQYAGIGVGESIERISEHHPIEFDEGDEMYYLVNDDGDYVPGLAIVGIGGKGIELSKVRIDGFTVHDWSLFRKI